MKVMTILVALLMTAQSHAGFFDVIKGKSKKSNDVGAEITLKGKFAGSVGPGRFKIVPDGKSSNDPYSVQNVPDVNLFKYQQAVEIKVKITSKGSHPSLHGYEFVSWGSSTQAWVNDKKGGIAKANQKRKKSAQARKNKSSKQKKRTIASLMKKHKSVGPSGSFLKSEMEVQDTDYKMVKFAVVEFHNFYHQLGANPKWEKDGKSWILRTKFKDKATRKEMEFTWVLRKNGKEVVPARLVINGNEVNSARMYTFLEQPATAIRKLREKS